MIPDEEYEKQAKAAVTNIVKIMAIKWAVVLVVTHVARRAVKKAAS